MSQTQKKTCNLARQQKIFHFESQNLRAVMDDQAPRDVLQNCRPIDGVGDRHVSARRLSWISAGEIALSGELARFDRGDKQKQHEVSRN